MQYFHAQGIVYTGKYVNIQTTLDIGLLQVEKSHVEKFIQYPFTEGLFEEYLW